MNCGLAPESELLVKYFLHDDKLSAPEWKALQTLITRTPAETRMQWCDHAFVQRVQSPVSLKERLEWLATDDCSPKRHPKLRGAVLEPLLCPPSFGDPMVPEPLRKHLTDQYASCIAHKK